MGSKVILALLALVGLVSIGTPAGAQGSSPELQRRAAQVVALLKGEADPAEMFSPTFLAQVPAAQVRAISEQLRAQYGAVRGLAGIEARSTTTGTIRIEMERAVLRMNIGIEAQPPHRIENLLVTGADVRGDTLAAVAEEIRALPGQTSFAVARLGEGAPELVASHQPDRPLAVGSTFKLFILAELSRQVQAGQRRWDEVATLDRRSLESGILQAWPAGSPVTLHTLAALMISRSDNTATDMLLHAVGRENVERMMATAGVRSAERNRPFLTTLEMFALKTAGQADQRAWVAAGESERRRLLESRYAARDTSGIDPALLTGRPLRIEELEWFFSAQDLIAIMDWLRRHADDTARAILTINPGIAPSGTSEFGYVGYKGGSEPGVINLTWLVRTRAGAWHVVTGSWNNPAAPIEEARFIGLMGRAVQLLR